jgi:hypothetical protein
VTPACSHATVGTAGAPATLRQMEQCLSDDAADSEGHGGGRADGRVVGGRTRHPAAAWLPLAALDRGQLTDLSQVTRAHEVRRHDDHELAALFGDVDVLVTPMTPETAFPLGGYEANLPAGDLCWAFNLSSHPAVTVPAGRGQPAGSAGPLASCPRLTSSAGVQGVGAEKPTPPGRPGIAWPRTGRYRRGGDRDLQSRRGHRRRGGARGPVRALRRCLSPAG